jgi:hypothetical protein
VGEHLYFAPRVHEKKRLTRTALFFKTETFEELQAMSNETGVPVAELIRVFVEHGVAGGVDEYMKCRQELVRKK